MWSHVNGVTSSVQALCRCANLDFLLGGFAHPWLPCIIKTSVAVGIVVRNGFLSILAFQSDGSRGTIESMNCSFFHLEPIGSGPSSKEQGQQILQGWQVWERHPVLHRGHWPVPHRAEDWFINILPEPSGSLRTAGWQHIFFKFVTLRATYWDI